MTSVPINRRRFFFADDTFAKHWPGFQEVGSALKQESGDVWKRMEDDLRRQPCMASTSSR
jgi:hypothetical protein